MPVTVAPTTTQPRFYKIQPGDTLGKIAAAFGLPIQAIMEKNQITDPDKIYAGQILELPVASEIVVTSLPPVTTVAGATVLPAITDRRTVGSWSMRTSGRRSTIGASRSPSTRHTSASGSSPPPASSSCATPTSTSLPSEYEALEYMDWKSGGDTNFAPIASADGELDCRGFWDKGKTDKDALWTSNAALVPDVA